MNKTDVSVAEYLDADVEGCALLGLVSRVGEGLVTYTTKMRLLSVTNNPENGHLVDVHNVTFDNAYNISLLLTNFEEKHTGFIAQAREGVGQALKNLFAYYTQPHGIIMVDPHKEDADKKYFCYDGREFKQVSLVPR